MATDTPRHCLCTLWPEWTAVQRNTAQPPGLNKSLDSEQRAADADVPKGHTHLKDNVSNTSCSLVLDSRPGSADFGTQEHLSDHMCSCMCFACEVSVNTHCCRSMKHRLWSTRGAARDCVTITKYSQVYSLHCPWKPLKCMCKERRQKLNRISLGFNSVNCTGQWDRSCSFGKAMWLWQTMGMNCREHSIARGFWQDALPSWQKTFNWWSKKPHSPFTYQAINWKEPRESKRKSR